jgi:hypothetical protein
MPSRLWSPVLLVPSLLCFAPPVLAAEPGSRPASALQGVPALDEPVTHTETKIPLGELVRKIAADTGEKLTAAREVADEPVAVVVKAMPARELLEQVAELLDFRWSRRVKRGAASYEIWQDLKSKQHEAALRDALLRAAEKELQEEVRRAVEMADLSQEQVRALGQAQQQRARELQRLPPEQVEALLRRPEEREKDRRYQLANYLWSPISQSLARLVGHLSADQWASLREDGQLRFSTAPKAGELPLPPEMERLFRTSPPRLMRPGEQVIFPDEMGGEERLHEREKQMQERWTGAAGYRVTVQWQDQLEMGGSLHVSATASPIDPGPPPPSYTISSGMELALDAAPKDLAEEEPDPATPERRAAWEKDPVLGARKPFEPEARPQTDHPNGPPGSGSTPPVQALLPELARRYDVSFIADSYWSTPPAYGFPRAGEPISLISVLDRLARPSHRWDCGADAEDAASKQHPAGRRLIRLRSRTWFLDRPREVPLRFVTRWRALQEQYAALPMDTYLEMAALRDEQLGSLSGLTAAGVLPRELPDLTEVYPARFALRLYASLTPAQRQALEQGSFLLVAQMSPAQRELFRKTEKESGRYQAPQPGSPEPAADRLLLTTERYVRVQEVRDGVSHYSRAAVPAPDPTGVAPRATDNVSGRQPTPLSTAGTPPARLPSAQPSVRVIRHSVTRLWFVIQRGAEKRQLGFMTIPSPSDS